MIDRFEQVNGPHPGFRRNHAKGLCVAGSFVANGPGARLSKASVFAADRATPLEGRVALAGGQPYAADAQAIVRSLALRLRLPSGEEWRTGMNNIPVFPVRTPEAFRQPATLIFAIATVATFIGMIILGNAIAGTILHHGFGYMADAQVAMRMSETGFAYALVIFALATFVFRVRDLMGPRVFTSLLVGRYHRPITEERIFLFLDVAGSTRFAEQHGDLAQRWLGAIFNALALPVQRSRGSVDDYVGDMALVSWSMDHGLPNAACLRCVFDFLRVIDADAERWQSRFGQVPAFWAAFHCGQVVTAEIGLERRKIAYFGDALNTASRLEGLAKEVGESVVVSGNLLDRLGEVPSDILITELGVHTLRGRDEPLRIAAAKN